ncbi:MAG: GatB/YqeY domain-containing protein [Acidimicrobiia bacterium]
MTEPATGLKEQLRGDLTDAIRAQDEVTVATLRLALSAITKAEVAGKASVTLTDEQILELLRGEAKRRAEAAELYEQGARAELAARERAQAAVLDRYLPKEMDDAALAAIVAEEVAVASADGTTGGRAMGQVIKAVRARVGTDASGSRIAAAVKAALGT